jgi:hypothetical protein
MTATKTEISLFVKMLESPEDYETPEDLAKQMIEALDEKRAEKTRFVAVGQFGKDQTTWYTGIGPYAREGECNQGRTVASGLLTCNQGRRRPGNLKGRVREASR